MRGARLVLGRNAAARAWLSVCLLAALTAACDPMGLFGVSFGGNPRLTVAWDTPRTATLSDGLSSLDAALAGTTGRVYVPAHYDPDTPIGLFVMLHGGGSAGSQYVSAFQALADSNDFILLAPDSKQMTWDLLSTQKVGVDIARLGDAIEFVLQRATIDPARLWLGGHSDGASYALTVGTANGDRFTKVVAFSAGMLWSPQKNGRPPVRIAHGQFDPVFAYADVARELVQPLENAGYTVTLAPFPGGHELSSEVAAAAILWAKGGL